MSFNDFCKYMIDKYNDYVCEDPVFINTVECFCPEYRTAIEDFSYWAALYMRSKS